MKYRLNEERYFADITDGIAIIINFETGIYYGFNLLTTDVFKNIISGADTDELLAALSNVKGYNEEIKTKYLGFLDRLIAQGFVAENAGASAAVQIGFDEYKNEELDFVISEYRDASELLLADPIHQVKEETGWKPGKEALK